MKLRIISMIGAMKILVLLSGCSGNESGASNEPVASAKQQPRLNDTGITAAGIVLAGDGSVVPIPCPDQKFPGQDGDYGRDARAEENSDGDAGFSFTKIDSDGNPLPATAETWSCVKDNVTGLLWEAKTSDGGYRDKGNTYSWYDPSKSGDAVGTANGGSCTGGLNCDTSSFVQAVNAAGLCGAADWRVPNVNELLSAAHYWKNPGLPVDDRFFPDQSQQLWSDTSHPFSSAGAWSVWFKWGSWASYTDKTTPVPIRLVSGEKLMASKEADRYVDNQDGTVTDNDSGLTWMKCVAGSTWNGQGCEHRYILGNECGGFGWQGFLNQTKCLNENGGFAGHQDWRLPNIKELASVVRWESPEHFNPHIFPNLPLYAPIFSSSPFAFTLNGVWVMEQSIAEMRAIDRGSWGTALLVRDER